MFDELKEDLKFLVDWSTGEKKPDFSWVKQVKNPKLWGSIIKEYGIWFLLCFGFFCAGIGLTAQYYESYAQEVAMEFVYNYNMEVAYMERAQVEDYLRSQGIETRSSVSVNVTG